MASPTSSHQDAVRVLTDKHRYQLEVESGVPAWLIEEEGIYSLQAGDPLPVPDAEFRHPDSHKGQRFPSWPSEITSGIVFPDWDHAGRANPKIRPDTPQSVWDENGRESRPKYEACGGARLSVYVPKRVRPLLDDITVPLVPTEGSKKVLAAVGTLGDRYAVVGLAGVDCFTYKPNPADKTVLGDKGKVRSVPLPDWDHIPMRGRIVLVPFDSDRAMNENVQYAEQRLCQMVKARGGIPIVVQLPCKPDGSKMGLDDCVVAGKDLKRILHGAVVARLERPEPLRPANGDGVDTCRRCAPMIEQVGKHRAEDQLIVHGPMPAQEAVLTRHLIQRAALAREKGQERFRAWVPELVEHANVSKSTVTRALNKLRHAEQDTLPITIEDEYEDGKLKVWVKIPKTIGDYPWTERRALMAMSRATLGDGDGRKKRGGSDAAAKARWRCPDHPKAAVTETVSRFYQCTADDCTRSWAAPTVARRIEGEPSRIQFECGSDERDVVDIFSEDYATDVDESRPQDDAVTSIVSTRLQVDAGSNDADADHTADPQGEGRIQFESGGVPVSFTSYADQAAAKGPNYWGEAHPDDLAAIRAAAAEQAPKPPPLAVHDIAPDSDRPWYAKRRQQGAGRAAGGAA